MKVMAPTPRLFLRSLLAGACSETADIGPSCLQTGLVCRPIGLSHALCWSVHYSNHYFEYRLANKPASCQVNSHVK
jgi:hypothetical protein